MVEEKGKMVRGSNPNITENGNKVFETGKYLNNFRHNGTVMMKTNIGLIIFELIECKDKATMFQPSSFKVIFTRE